MAGSFRSSVLSIATGWKPRVVSIPMFPTHCRLQAFKGVHQDYRLALHRSLAGYIDKDKDVYRVWADYAFDYSNFRRFLLYVAALQLQGVFWELPGPNLHSGLPASGTPDAVSV